MYKCKGKRMENSVLVFLVICLLTVSTVAIICCAVQLLHIRIWFDVYGKQLSKDCMTICAIKDKEIKNMWMKQ